MHFNGERRHEWPKLAEELLVMGARNGGWDEALETKLDLTDSRNKRLNKLAWAYLTLMLERDALHEMDMVPSKHAYEVWQHLKWYYQPRNGRKDVNMKTEDQQQSVQTDYDFEKLVKATEQENQGQEQEEKYCYIALWDEDGENKRDAEKREEEHEDVPYLVEEDKEGELEFNEREQECHEPLEEDEEENPNREECQGDPHENIVERSVGIKHVEENHESFSVESMKNAETDSGNKMLMWIMRKTKRSIRYY